MKLQLPTLERVYSHSLRLDYRPVPEREELFLTFAAEWRGKPARVQMSADRYRYTDGGLSDWRVFASEAREYDPENGGRGPALTETARHRLSEACAPIVRDWLASDAYVIARRCALAHAIRGKLTDLRPWSEPTRDARRLLVLLADEMEPASVERLTRACDAYDRFSSILNGTDET